MNRQQRRAAGGKGKQERTIHFHDKSYTVQEAGQLAIKEQQRDNAAAAVAIYNLIIARVPDHVDAHNNRAVAFYSLQMFNEALADYDKTVELKPDYADAWNNRGITLHALGKYDEAGASYDKAVALNPNHADAHHNRGVSLQAIRRYDEALASYDKAIALKLGYIIAHKSRGNVLHLLKRYDEALASYAKAIALDPDYAEAYKGRGASLRDLKLYDEAQADFSKAVALDPRYAEAWNSLGDILVSKGDMKEAERAFEKALELKAGYPNPLFGLANIRKYKDPGHPDIKNIRRLLGDPATPQKDMEVLHYALGKMCDDVGLYDEAFENYLKANRQRNTLVSYDPKKMEKSTDNIIEVFSKEFLAGPLPFASGNRSPIFVIGMPRSGTTLMSSILSNHPAIATAGELPTIGDFASRLTQLVENGEPIHYPHSAKYMTAEMAARLAKDYEERLRRDVGAKPLHVVDKHPLNFRHAGFISLLFPRALIIHSMRHPLDTCLSNYFQRFQLGLDYSFDLENLGHFYKEYVRLMEHWHKVLPTPMFEAQYEEVVTDTETVARKILGALELEWDACCLTPDTNKAPVETASKWQVRQPIYKRSVERWQRYEKHIGALKEMLKAYC